MGRKTKTDLQKEIKQLKNTIESWNAKWTEDFRHWNNKVDDERAETRKYKLECSRNETTIYNLEIDFENVKKRADHYASRVIEVENQLNTIENYSQSVISTIIKGVK